MSQIQAYAKALGQVLLGQVPSLEQKEIEFAAAYPFGLIYQPYRSFEERLPGEQGMAEQYMLLNYGVGSADVGRFLPDPAKHSAIEATELFQAMKDKPGLTYVSLGPIKPVLANWARLGDEIEVGGAASVTGSEKTNDRLSELRAREMKQWLMDELSADPDKVKVRWVGERPWAPQFDNDASGLFVQRRVELHRLRRGWDMDEFDRVGVVPGSDPETQRVNQLIEHLQASKDDLCVIMSPTPFMRQTWTIAIKIPQEEEWMLDTEQWDSHGPASLTGIVTKLRWVVEKRLHPGMSNDEIVRKMREIDKQLMLVRSWTHWEVKKAKATKGLLDLTGLYPDDALLGGMEKQLNKWFTRKEKDPDSIYHSIYVVQ